MDKQETLQKLKKRNQEIDAIKFEHLCKNVVEEVEDPDGIETTRRSKDHGIDIQGYIGNEFYTGEFGVQVKQYSNKISSGAVRELAGSLQGEGFGFGTLITTSSFTKDAAEKVSETEFYSINLIDGDELAELMLEYEVGVTEQPTEEDGERMFAIDPEFWNRFDKFAGDLIPAWKIPQADSFDVIDLVLEAISEGIQYKPEIAEFLSGETGDSWTPRQADYYTTAASIMGYLEEDESEDKQMRKWELTELGEEYVSRLQSGDEEAVEEHFSANVGNIEIIQKIVDVLEEDYKIPKSKVEEIIRDETAVTGTTVGRRASTVGKWLGKHPDVKRQENGMLWFEYYKMDLTDF